MFLPIVLYSQRIWYVDHQASGSDDGRSWAHAFTNLQEAIDRASEKDEIWMAKGSYTPSLTGDRSVHYIIEKSISIYGGFNGTENTLSQRDPRAHPTIISGEINDPASKTDNSSRLFEIEGKLNLLVDGLIFQDVYGDSGGNPDFRLDGAGAILVNNTGFIQTISFRNCEFLDHFAGKEGAVFKYLDNSNSEITLQFISCRFSGNAALESGSVFKIEMNSPKAKFLMKDCVISENDPLQLGNSCLKLSFGSDGNQFLMEGCRFENNSMKLFDAFISLRFQGDTQFTMKNTKFLNNHAIGQMLLISMSSGPGSLVDLRDIFMDHNYTFDPAIRISSNSFGQDPPKVMMENIEISHHRNTETWHLIDLKEVKLIKFDNTRFLHNWGGPLNVSPLYDDIVITNCLVAYNEFRDNDFSNQFSFNNAQNHDISFVNCTFAHNAGRKGSIVRTIFNRNEISPGDINFANCIFYDNYDFDTTNPNPDRLVFTKNTNVNFDYCLFEQERCSDLVTIEQLGKVNCGENAQFLKDPHFLSAEDFYLAFCSPAVDAGINAPIDTIEFDLDRNSRIQNERVDLGAFENTPVQRYIGFSCRAGVIYSDWLSGIEEDTEFEYLNSGIEAMKKNISRVVMRSPGGCTDTLSFPTTELDGVMFLHDEVYELNYAGDTIPIGIRQFSAETYEYAVYPDLPFYFSNDNSRLHIAPTTGGKYYLTAVNEFGCFYMDSIEVKIADLSGLFYVANVFVPGPGENNGVLSLHYQGDEILTLEFFQIYDRLGNRQHFLPGRDFQESIVLWDGRNQNEEILPGVYVYYAVIRRNEEVIRLSGDVTVVR